MKELLVQLQGNVWLTAFLCALTGYFLGSISSARLVFAAVKKSKNYEPFREPIPHTDEVFESSLISATWVTKKIGKRYGCITSIADMIKVAAPTFAAKLLLTTQPFFLVTAIFGILGHNYPVYYRFRGGRGESPILACLAIINWFGILIANGIASILGFITGSILVLRWGGYILMIFWYWYWFNDIRYVLFMVFANILFWLSMRNDLMKFWKLKKKYGNIHSEEEVSEFIEMGKSMGRMIDKYGLYHIIRRYLGSNNKNQ